MVKRIFEELGGRYERQGDYLIPGIALPAEKEQPIGIWGQRHLDYLKQHRKVIYTNLFTSGRLNAYFADVDRQAQERFERLIEGMKQTQGITDWRQRAMLCRFSFRGVYDKATTKSNVFVNIQPDRLTKCIYAITISMNKYSFKRGGLKCRSLQKDAKKFGKKPVLKYCMTLCFILLRMVLLAQR